MHSWWRPIRPSPSRTSFAGTSYGRMRGPPALWPAARSYTPATRCGWGPKPGLSWFSREKFRVRLSGATEVELAGRRALRFVSGRVWVLRSGPKASAPFRVAIGNLSVEVPVASSVVIERRRVGGGVVASRAGLPSVGPTTISPGWIADFEPHGGKPLRVRRGGAALAEIVVGEARRARNDPARLRAFLVGRARSATVLGSPSAPGGHLVHRARDEIVGSDRGPAGARLEDSLRPPPFFESEIPPVGPNVRVEVEFE